MKKVALIGAGSVTFAKTLINDILFFEPLAEPHGRPIAHRQTRALVAVAGRAGAAFAVFGPERLNFDGPWATRARRVEAPKVWPDNAWFSRTA